mmetsp:Transcript_71759/g.185098  ORF Transcript_71759/g.185098 Transcript_71759/m.185098 type:complete len:275 (-) Transcript_71759:286-1110(-)
MACNRREEVRVAEAQLCEGVCGEGEVVRRKTLPFLPCERHKPVRDGLEDCGVSDVKPCKGGRVEAQLRRGEVVNVCQRLVRNRLADRLHGAPRSGVGIHEPAQLLGAALVQRLQHAACHGDAEVLVQETKLPPGMTESREVRRRPKIDIPQDGNLETLEQVDMFPVDQHEVLDDLQDVLFRLRLCHHWDVGVPPPELHVQAILLRRGMHQLIDAAHLPLIPVATMGCLRLLRQERLRAFGLNRAAGRRSAGPSKTPGLMPPGGEVRCQQPCAEP